MGCCSGIFRLLMFIFNFACLLVGIVLIAVGTLFYISVDQYDKLIGENSGFNIVPSVTLAIGVIIFIISFFGCCGALKHNSCLLYTYAAILIVLLIVQFSISIYGFVIADNDASLKDDVIREMKKAFAKYGSNNDVTSIFDSIQVSLECCGVEGKDDYPKLLLRSYPASCCGNSDDSTPCKNPYEDGCGTKFFDALNDAIYIVAIVALVICAVEILGAIFAICLARK